MLKKQEKILGKRKQNNNVTDQKNNEPARKKFKKTNPKNRKSKKNFNNKNNEDNNNNNKQNNEKPKPKSEIKGVLWEEITPTQQAQHLQAIYESVVQDFQFNFKPEHIVQMQGPCAEATEKSLGDKNKLQVSQEGSPVALFVSSSGIRACNIVRALRPFGKCAKLISKIKLHETRDYLSQNKVGLGAGTSTRIQKLIEQGILSLDNLQYIVIDLRRDAKTWTVLDMKETKNAFMKMLNNEQVRQLIVKGRIKLCFWAPPEEDNAIAKAKKSSSEEENKSMENNKDPEKVKVKETERDMDENGGEENVAKEEEKKQKKNKNKKKKSKNKKKQKEKQ